MRQYQLHIRPIIGLDIFIFPSFLNINSYCAQINISGDLHNMTSIINDLCRIFRLRGSTKCLGGPIFEGLVEILLLGKAFKFGVIFQKYE